MTTKPATNVAETSATLNGSISTNNTSVSFTAGFFISTSGTPSISNNVKKVESGSNKTGNYSSSVTGLALNTTYNCRAYVLYDGNYYYGSTEIFTTKKSITGYLNGHEWVDLGLPSGLKWATCNVGASTPESYGGYYAWGETEEKNTYDWDNYIYGYYNKCSNIGSDIAGTRYDVAHMKWGSSWVMPSLDQIKELLDNCTSEWITQNGVKGRKFTSKKNGGSIFFPAAGKRDLRVEIQDVGIAGYYWLSTKYPTDLNYAFNLYFNSSNKYSDYYARSIGFSVRAVTR